MPKKLPEQKFQIAENSVTIGKELGQSICKMRNNLHLSQEDAAWEINISQTLLSNVETGKHKINVRILQLLAIFLQTQVSVFISKDGEVYTEPDLVKMIQRLRKYVSQRTLAAEIGTNSTTMSFIEAGKFEINMYALKWVMKYFEFAIKIIITETGKVEVLAEENLKSQFQKEVN
jgi:DNA-binding XRE family transcriptional regulator